MIERAPYAFSFRTFYFPSGNCSFTFWLTTKSNSKSARLSSFIHASPCEQSTDHDSANGFEKHNAHEWNLPVRTRKNNGRARSSVAVEELWHLLRTNKARRRTCYSLTMVRFEFEAFFHRDALCLLRAESKLNGTHPRMNGATGKCSAFCVRSITIVSAILSDAPHRLVGVCTR